jgi:uncharacterized membrane-anchored protein
MIPSERSPSLLSSRLSLLIIGVALQAMVLLATGILAAVPFLLGERGFLAVVPVDPTHLIKGDYVTLSYAFSTKASRLNDLPCSVPRYVPLTKELSPSTGVSPGTEEHRWIAGEPTLKKPESGYFLKSSCGDHQEVEFGIEKFYTEKEKAKEYESPLQARKLQAEIAVTSSGKASVIRLVFDPR